MSNIEINIKVIIDDKDISKAFEFAEQYEKFHKMCKNKDKKEDKETDEIPIE